MNNQIAESNSEETVWFDKDIVLSKFGQPEFREKQKETIEEAAEAFEKGYRYVILDGPTGSGKSEIAATFSRASDSAHILTVQKLLQDQYQNDYPEMFCMKGRTAYTCVRGGLLDTCSNGPCRRKKMDPCDTCPYLIAKSNALTAPITVHNFDSFYYQNTFGEGFPGRKLLVIDEAHNISNKFSAFLGFTIESRRDMVVPEESTIEDYEIFVRRVLVDSELEYDTLYHQYEVSGLSKDELRRMQDTYKMIRRMKLFLSEREKDIPSEFVFEYTSKGDFAPKVTFKPVMVGAFASRWLFSYGERVLLMSATILDKELFCKEVGINPNEAYYLKMPSTFPPENRPILKRYVGKMGYKYIDDTLPAIAKAVQEIANKHPNRKGIVQTHSEKIAKYLQSTLRDDRFTYNKDFPRPQDMLETHKRKPGSIIIASGLREGLDLIGDLSQIQVFCKIPYPSLADKVVERKLQLDDRWYGWITVLSLVQALGRSVRSPKDKAVSYILDSGFGWFYKKNEQFIPDYIKEAIKW